MKRREFLKTAAATAGVAGAALLLPVGLRARPLKRVVEVYDKGTWHEVTWEGLKKDDIFRLRELDGSIVDEGTKHEISVATSDAIPRPAPEYHRVEAEPFTHIDMGHPLASRVKVVKDGEFVGRVQSIDMKHSTALVTHLKPGETAPAGLGIMFAEQLWSFDYAELGPA